MFASIILSLALMLGVTPSQPDTQPVSVSCEEDMPCWDSATMGQQLPRLSDAEIDAWEAVSAANITYTPTHILEYVETLDYRPASLPLGYFTLASNTQPQTYHVIRWTSIYYA